MAFGQLVGVGVLAAGVVAEEPSPQMVRAGVAIAGGVRLVDTASTVVSVESRTNELLQVYGY